MRRSDEDFKIEVFKRYDAYKAKKKKQRMKVIYTCTSIAACVVLFVIVGQQANLFGVRESDCAVAATDALGEYNDTEGDKAADSYINAEGSNGIKDNGKIDYVTDGIAQETQTSACNLTVNASYTRVDGSGDGDRIISQATGTNSIVNTGRLGLPIIRIDDIDEYKKFTEETLANESFWQSAVEELKALYEDTIFAESALFIIYVGEGSGSVRHKVSAVEIKGGVLEVAVESIVPEIGTCDMAGWLISFTVDKNILAENGCSDQAAYRK